MKARIGRIFDEAFFPMYDLDTGTEYQSYGVVVEITEEDLYHYQRIMKEFNKLQDWLKKSVKEIENESTNL